MRFLYIFALLTLVATCVVTSALAATRDYDLRLVQVVHRHGARSPLVGYNTSLICPPDYACGNLNAEGQQMMVNVGSFLRDRYTTDATVVDPASPFIAHSGYNLAVSYTRSTDILRTLQSADGFLRGLFPDMSAYYPVVHTVDTATDLLLLPDSVPALNSVSAYGRPGELAVCDPVVDAFFTQDDLVAIGNEVYAGGRCLQPSGRTSCAKDLCDIGLAYGATGVLPNHPLLSANLDNLCSVTAASTGYFYEYNASDPVKKKQGSLGQALAQEVLSNMKRTASGSGSSYRVREYSAHDTTLAGFASTLGDNSRVAMLPPFSSTYVFELLTPTSSSSDWYVRVLRGYPGQTPDTNFVFQFDTFPMQCMDANNVAYTAQDNVCPLADFTRFVDSSKPTDPAGLCYLDPAFAAQMGCSTDAEKDTTALSGRCRSYRTTCPAFACADGYSLDANNLGCYNRSSSETTDTAGNSTVTTCGSKGLHGGQIAGVVIGCFFGGALVALAAVAIKLFCFPSKTV